MYSEANKRQEDDLLLLGNSAVVLKECHSFAPLAEHLMCEILTRVRLTIQASVRQSTIRFDECYDDEQRLQVLGEFSTRTLVDDEKLAW